MFRRLLVPYDGSPASRAALAQAVSLARESAGRLRVIHVIGELSTMYAEAHGWDAARVRGQMKQAAKEALADALQPSHTGGVETESAILDSPDRPVWAAIIEDAGRWQPDVIVIGTHGRRGISRMVMGSDAESVIRSSPMPVLTVRAPAP